MKYSKSENAGLGITTLDGSHHLLNRALNASPQKKMRLYGKRYLFDSAAEKQYFNADIYWS